MALLGACGSTEKAAGTTFTVSAEARRTTRVAAGGAVSELASGFDIGAYEPPE